jgi:hypothetical protein
VAFPTTGILDDFNRSDEGPPPSASWADILNGLKVVSNECAGDNAGGNISYWKVATGADCEVYWTLVNAEYTQGVVMRLADVGAIGTLDGYEVLTTSALTVAVFRIDNGVETKLGADVSQAVGAGDKLGARMEGTTLHVWYDDGGAGWGEIGDRLDETYQGGGYIGGVIVGTSQRGGSFGGGTMPGEGAVAGRLVGSLPLKSLVHGGLV